MKRNKIVRTKKETYYYNFGCEKVIKYKKPILAWHLIEANLLLRYDDGRVVKPGQLFKVHHDARIPLKFAKQYRWHERAQIVSCRRGLHASIKFEDAYSYCKGPIVCRVELSGWMIKNYDKICATQRKVLWMANINDIKNRYPWPQSLESKDIIKYARDVLGIKNAK